MPSGGEEEVLVFGSRNEVYVFDGRKVKKICERGGYVCALAVCNNELYDGGRYVVFTILLEMKK
jgi:hypothetical protein